VKGPIGFIIEIEAGEIVDGGSGYVSTVGFRPCPRYPF
jgi:hypothetical protein